MWKVSEDFIYQNTSILRPKSHLSISQVGVISEGWGGRSTLQSMVVSFGCGRASTGIAFYFLNERLSEFWNYLNSYGLLRISQKH